MPSFRTNLVVAAALAGSLAAGIASQAWADETTTTTTTTEHHDDGPAAIVTAPVRAAGAIVDSVVGARPEGCTHKSMTKTDEVTGESVTKSRTDCN